jgi:signal transduction histidine kinase
MRLLSSLWQQIFVYSLLLIVFSGAVGMYLIHGNLDRQSASMALDIALRARSALTGASEEDAKNLLLTFNRQKIRFWIEDENGALLAGKPFAGLDGDDRAERLGESFASGDVTVRHTLLDNCQFLASAPLDLRGERGPLRVTLYAAYIGFIQPPLESVLSPSLLTLALITGLLALWMARKVSMPLRRLQREVNSITSALRLRSVTVSGSDEIADMARAVNRLVKELQQHIDGMNHLALNISHEMRSPLTRLALAVEMVGEGLDVLRRLDKKGDPDDEEVTLLAEKNLEAIRLELDHMARLVESTLASSRLEVMSPGDITGRVSLGKLRRNAEERFVSVFEQAGVRFSSSMGEDMEVVGDETLLMSALSNLLDNAAKYAAGPNPEAELRLYRNSGMAVLEVRNTHPPLPEDVLRHAFDA